MIGKTRSLALGGASLLAIIAASALAPSQAYAACVAVPSTVNDEEVVNVVCATVDPEDPVMTPFATLYPAFLNGSGIPISTGNGNDTLTMTGGVITEGVEGDFTPVSGTDFFLDPREGIIEMLGGDDIVEISGGQIGSPDVVSLSLGDGADTFVMSGGTLSGSVFGDGGDDDIEVSGNAIITGVPGISAAIETGAGNSEVRILGGTIGTDPTQLAIFLEDGANIFAMSGGAVNGNIVGQGGGNDYTLGGGVIDGFLSAGSGNDTVLISGGTITGDVSGEGGNDTIIVSGGSIGSTVAGNEGTDTITVSGGSIGSTVAGNEGTDTITVSGGSIAGDVAAETVTLTGGSIGGNIVGITGNTLVINDSLSPAPLDLSDGVVFSGTNAVATINNTDLAAGGSKAQVFSGFDSVTAANNSTLRFDGSTIGIQSLALRNSSTLFANGNVVMPGSVQVINSTIDMIDGVADDVLTLGGLALSNGRLNLDVDLQAVNADRLVVGTFSAAGRNIVGVNLLGTPVFSTPTEIPILQSSSGPIEGNFDVEQVTNTSLASLIIVGIPGTPGSLFVFDIVVGPNGGLFLRAVPANFNLVLHPQVAVDSATVENVVESVYRIIDDPIASDLGLVVGSQGAQISPTMGVYASGQFAHTEHDGFTATSDGFVGAAAPFDADEFSAAISVDFNAAKHFALDQQYGLNIGLFAGYASTDVALGAFQGFDQVGDATNQSGMFGAYGLFRQDYNYALVSATAFLGGTDVSNGVLGTTGSYDTQGYAVTGSIGHIFKLSDRARFDLRGGLLGVTFNGNEFTDSGGNNFGDNGISFGAVRLDPGIYADYQLENEMVLSPYARVDLQQRFGYTNTASIDSVEIEFEDTDFSAAVSTGFNLKMSEMATMSGEVRGKFSSDSSTIAGKLGLKIAF